MSNRDITVDYFIFFCRILLNYTYRDPYATISVFVYIKSQFCGGRAYVPVSYGLLKNTLDRDFSYMNIPLARTINDSNMDSYTEGGIIRISVCYE